MPNVGANARTGQVTIAGQTFTVTQQGSPCAFAIEPTLRIHTSASEFAIVNVTAPAGCDWQIINPNDWMIIKLYTGGVGNGIARYTVFANPNPTTRTGTLTIAGQTFTVVQLGAPCGYSILPTERLFGPASGTGVLAVASVTGCGWNVSNTNSWIWITSPANGLGNGGGTVSYDVTASLVPNDRTGVVNVAGQSFTVTQLGSTCSASLSASSRNLTTSAAASGTVGVSMSGGCSSTKWRVYNPNSWITITANSQGKGNANVAYSVAANTGAARTGVLTIADKTFTITQAGVPCTYSLSAPSRNHTYLSEPGAFNVTVFSGCAWNVVNTSSWVTVTSGASGVGNGAVAYQLAANPGPARIARLVLGGQVFTINQGQIEPVVFTSLPASRGVLPGATATFTAAVTGTAPVSFQWLFNGTALVNGPGVSGATTPSLSLANVQLAQAGSYTLVAANLRGPVTSSPPAVLTINTPPMLAALGSRITMRGSLLAFTASATDAQVPGQTLTYSLEPGAPAGSSINATNGLFTWTPGAAQGPSTNSVSVRVTDSGSPPLSDVETMTIFVVTNGSVTTLPLVPIGAVWKYRDTGENLGTAWVAPAFPDDAWASGPAILGYGDGGEGTVVSFGSSSSAKSITTYFRRAFTVTDPASLNALNLRVLRNDGVIVYLNGAEIYRDNMPAGPVSSSTPALANSTNPERSTYQITPPLDPGRLLAGTNVLAAELHIYSGGAGNMGFDLELTGTKNDLPPLILNQPQSRSMPIGGQVSFTVMVAVNLPMNYQWHFQGARLPDATNSSLFLANLQPASAGAYFVVLTNSIGAVTSTVASLTLTQAPNAAPILSAASAKTISDGNVLTWTPATGYAPSTNPATLRVTDSGSTPLSDTKTFNVVVLSPPLLLNASLALDGRVSLLWNAVPGQKYRVQCTTHLASGIWTNLGSDVMAVSDTASATDRELDAPQRFYRIVVADE